MSLFQTVRQFFSGSPAPTGLTDTPAPVVAEPVLTTSADDWTVTTGRLYQPQQERNVTYHNSEINGTCTGQIGELVGSAMVGLFEDLPAWLPSLLVRATVEVGEGELTLSLRERNGTIVSVVAPGSLEADAELTDGRIWLRCESGRESARAIRYKVVII